MDDRIWNVFLSLQGDDENTPPPSKDIVASFEGTENFLTDYDVFNYFPLRDGREIIIIGAGSGAEVKSFINHGYYVTGICLHNSDKKFAKNEYGIDLIIEDMHNMKSISSESFDGVYSYHSLEHSIAPILVIFEIRRILRYYGKLLFFVPYPGTNDETGEQHYSVLREDHWKHLLKLAGFDNIQIDNIEGNMSVKARKSGDTYCNGARLERRIRLIRGD